MTGEKQKERNGKHKEAYPSAERPVPVISNSRARGVLILIGTLLLFQVITFVCGLVREKRKTVAAETAGESAVESGEKPLYTEKKRSAGMVAACFRFDPNTLSRDSFMLLGFSSKQAQVILNYREKGGRFRRREDFGKMYVVSAEKYGLLEKWIDILPDTGRVRPAEKRGGPEDGQRNKFQQFAGKGAVAAVLEDTASVRKKWVCNLNTADSAELVKLYGIGPYLARKIINYRVRLGGSFAVAEQLMEIEGIDRERFEGFRERLVINPQEIRRFPISRMEREFMEKHPYIGAYAARGILLYREWKSRNGTDEITLEELVRENILSPVHAGRLSLYINEK